MERSWKNEGATGGKATSGGGRDNGMNKRNPSPPVAHSCGLDRMVRRGRRFESVRGLPDSPCLAVFPLSEWTTVDTPDVHAASTPWTLSASASVNHFVRDLCYEVE